jgi:hypothetical protein
MTKNVIDFEAAKQQRIFDEIDADEDCWNHTRDRLVAILEQAPLSPISLLSASLRSLVDVLEERDGMDRAQIILAITKRLPLFLIDLNIPNRDTKG